MSGQQTKIWANNFPNPPLIPAGKPPPPAAAHTTPPREATAVIVSLGFAARTLAMASLPDLVADSMSASGRTSEKLNITTLQPKMKSDPECYTTELHQIYARFKSSFEIFQEKAASNFTFNSGGLADSADPKESGSYAMFLAHVTPFYPKELAEFPNELVKLLESSGRNLFSGLRLQVTQALILLSNRKVRFDIAETSKEVLCFETAFRIIDIDKTLVVFMELQTVGDRALQKLAFSHVIHSIRRMNQKHKNDTKNRALQNILFGMLQQEEEAKAKRALITLCEFHRRKVWFDDRTANAICTACFHASPRIMIAALSFLLDFEKIEDDDDTDESDSEDEAAQPRVVLNKEAIYKANHKGTVSSKKKKKAKLERAIRSMKKQQRLSSEKNSSNYYSPLNHLKDAQGFAEKLFSRLQTSKERFEVKMMMVKVIARTVGLHHLILLNFYPYLQKYVQPHQRDVTSLLAAAVQACHDMVPPDAIEPLFKQIVNQFVHDKSRTEAIAVGLNVVREICLRMPLLMTEDLLQDLVLYRKSHEKAVSSAARSLLTLFREVCPSLLVKKDRGRPADPKAKPKAFGEVHVSSNIPGVELLEQADDGDSDEDIEGEKDGVSSGDDGISLVEEENDDGDSECEVDDEDLQDDDMSDEDDNNYGSDEEENEEEDSEVEETDNIADMDKNTSKAKKRKFSDFEGELNAASNSLRALKKLAGASENATSDTNDGILSNEDFQRIKELKAKKEARTTLTQHGFKLPTSDQLSTKRIDAATLEANIKLKLTKDERLALIRAGREDRGKYQARTAIKQKKTGGTSNRQKEHKKAMPLAAKRAKIAKSRQEKKKLKKLASKQFRGRKAWKQ
ncbi:hypothetical protein BUALT_Bualt17G0029900 [Buddleja alternifolia]|uniref:Protein SDA1 n=1 Tax=Buddleja alternifolia TaxID=168488 RepID=A0AAV6W7A9_9LAMI|nr:hypothetical protein BUALT_Bualt17G0029900 [Buddleja alternifolia]